jgi:hypothetical protein
MVACDDATQAGDLPGGGADCPGRSTLEPRSPMSVINPLTFDPRPDEFVHWKLVVDGDIARLVMDVQEGRGLKDDYVLKLNS